VLFTTDGVGREIYRIAPGNNGRFDGVAPAGDDVVTHFDVAVHGIDDAEGVGYDPVRNTLFVADRDTKRIIEVTPSGQLLTVITFANVSILKPSSVTVAPASNGSGARNLYVGDRGVDNDSVSSENDGKIVEMSAALPPLGNRPPEVSAGPDRSVTLPGTASLTGTVSDDGLPAPPATVTSQWSKVSGPGAVSFVDAGSPSTSVSVSEPGSYVLRLSSSDSELSASDDVVLTAVGPNGPFDASIVVAAAVDDAEESSTGKVNTSSSDLELVNDGNNQTVGMRFFGVPVPRGARITSAYVQFTADSAASVATSLTLRAFAQDSTPTFATTALNVSSRPRTSAAVSWVPAAWASGAAGPDQRTPALAELLQEVVSRPGWTAGNAAGIVVTGTGKRTAEAFSGGTPPVLHLSYVTNAAPVVSAGPDVSRQLTGGTLNGAVSDDGLPLPPGTVTSSWSKVSGPGSVTFDSAATPVTGVTFGVEGTYVLQLTGDDSALTSSDQVTVTVLDDSTPVDDPPVAALTVAATGPLHASADASGSTDVDATPIADYTFDWGDGTPATGPQSGATADHDYSVAGTYTVTVTVRDTAGLSDSAAAEVTVDPPTQDDPPAAALTVTNGPAPSEATADASASTDVDATPIADYTFDWGDGTAPTGPQSTAIAMHTYGSPGTYTVTVSVRDTAGLTGTASQQVTVAPVANLVGNPGFEVNLNGWNAKGTGATIARVAGGHSGGFAARLTNTAGAPEQTQLNDSPNWVLTSSPGSYTGTLWARSDVGGQTLVLRFREYVSGNLVASAQQTLVLTSTWRQVAVSLTAVSPGQSTLDFIAYVSNNPAGASWFADDAVISHG
jgi:PKD repeat protein